jgi:hypothetical protein
MFERLVCCNRLWFLGLALVVVGAIADFVALGLAAQSIIAPVRFKASLYLFICIILN